MIDYTAGSVPDALRRAHPDGIDVLIDLASDADGFAALASLVRSGGTALKTRFQYAADIEALASRGVAGVNYELHASSGVLERLADAVVSGRIVAPLITRITLDDVPGLNGRPGPRGRRSSPSDVDADDLEALDLQFGTLAEQVRAAGEGGREGYGGSSDTSPLPEGGSPPSSSVNSAIPQFGCRGAAASGCRRDR